MDGVQADDPTTATDHIARGQLIVRYAGRTAVGQVREHNEDNFVIANLSSGQIRPRDQSCEDEIGERGMLFSVCDGMGGAAAGEVASQMAVDILVEAMRRGAVPKNRDALARRLVQAVEEAGRRIFQSAQKERSRRGMGTTTTAAVLIDKVLFLGEVGDSRGYLLRDGQMKQITKDQSLVNQLIEAGHLTEDEAEAFEHSNIILQALGTAESVNVDLTFVELRKGDRLLLCSDGLSGLVHADGLRATLSEVKDPTECCGKLIELAEAGGGHDNITCIVADFDGDQLAAPAEGDGFGYMQYPLPLSDDDSSAFTEDDTAGGPTREPQMDTSTLPTQRPLAVSNPHDDDPSEADDSRANALWILAGAVALIGALGVWWTLDPKAQGTVAQPVAPDPAPAAAPAAELASEEVQVNVYTDVSATLLVNGEDKGAVTVEQSKSLKLKPGAYRFEAQADGQPKAVSVVTVRGDMPMDVFLKSPAAAEAPKPEGPKPEGPEGKPEEPKGETRTAEPEDKPRAIAPGEPAPGAAPDEPRPERPRRRAAPAEEPASGGTAPAAPGSELPSNPF